MDMKLRVAEGARAAKAKMFELKSAPATPQMLFPAASHRKPAGRVMVEATGLTRGLLATHP